MKTKNWILEVIVYLLAMLFVITACSKLADLEKFTWQVNNQSFDNRFTPLLVYSVPAAELLLSLFLLWPRMRLIGLYGSAMLMTVFSIYIALVTFNFYERVPCGCAFGLEKLSWPQHLAMNLCFTIMTYAGIYLKQSNKRP